MDRKDPLYCSTAPLCLLGWPLFSADLGIHLLLIGSHIHHHRAHYTCLVRKYGQTFTWSTFGFWILDYAPREFFCWHFYAWRRGHILIMSEYYLKCRIICLAKTCVPDIKSTAWSSQHKTCGPVAQIGEQPWFGWVVWETPIKSLAFFTFSENLCPCQYHLRHLNFVWPYDLWHNGATRRTTLERMGCLRETSQQVSH